MGSAVGRDDSEMTIVRPRLSLNPGALPEMPAQPDFESKVGGAQSRSQVLAARIMPTAGEEAPSRVSLLLSEEAESPERVREARREKVVIELPPKERPLPVRQTEGEAKPKALNGSKDSLKDSKTLQRPERLKGSKGLKDQKVARGAEPADRFSALVQSRTLMVPLIIFILAALVASYYVLHLGGVPFGIGVPTEIEVVTPGLNVRMGPSMRDPVLGVAPKGSRHRVVTRSEQWMQIDVGAWEESEPHVADRARGWVYARSDYVRVVARRLW